MRTHVDEPEVYSGTAAPHEVVEEPAGPGLAAHDAARSITGMLAGLVVLSLMVVELFLGGRLAFQLGEANPRNGFVDFVYDVSGPLVEPFDGIFSVEALDGGGIFDPNILMAMAVYLIAAILVLALLAAVIAPLITGTRPSYMSRRMHQH